MTILHVADLHFQKPWYQWLENSAPPHDLLVIAGDLLDLSHPAPHERQVRWVTDWLRDYPRPVSVCSGNHDLVWDSEHHVWWPARWLQSLKGTDRWVDGQSGALDGVSFLNLAASGRAHTRSADIWITHAPPLGPSVGWHKDGRAGSDAKLLYSVRNHRPSVVLCGHVHSPLSWIDRFEGTLYLNPGQDLAAPFPNHVLIDFTEGSVRRVRGKNGGIHQDVIIDLSGLPTPRPAVVAAAESEFALVGA